MNLWLLVLTFAASTAAVVALLYLLTSHQRTVRRRIAGLSESDEPAAEQAADRDSFPTVTKLLESSGKLQPIQLALARAGLQMKPSEYVALVATVAVLLMAVIWLLSHNALLVIAAAFVPVLAGVLALSMLRGNRMQLFERQLAEALVLMASSLRSGYSVLRAIQTVSEEMPAPISTEFAQVAQEVSLGLPLEDALLHMADRVPSYDLELMVTAVIVQMEVGGNLASILETLAATIRERNRIRAEIRALTAEGRMSGVILLCLPTAMAGLILVVNRPYFVPLITTTMGHLLIFAALALQLVGALVIKRMLDMDF